MAALTDKQQVFVEEYLTCWNATEAARRAEYRSPEKQGWQLLGKTSIQTVIQRRLSEKAMPADEVLARIAEQARGDIRSFLRFEPDPNDSSKMLWTGLDITPDKPLHLIKKLKPTKYGTEIELHDPFAALTLLAKHHGLLKELDLTNLPDVVLKALAEALDIRGITTKSKA